MELATQWRRGIGDTSALPALVKRVATSLPDFSFGDLRQCTTPKHLNRPSLESCHFLANPGTGSSTLAHRFFHHPNLTNYSAVGTVGHYPRRMLFPGAWSHSHAVSAAMISQKLLRGGNLGRTKYRTKRIKFPPARCFVVTVRDPAERLASGYRSSDATNGRLARWSGELKAAAGARNLGAVVAHLRAEMGSERRSGAANATSTNNSALMIAYENSAGGHPRWCCLPGDYPPPEGGDLFLLSQLQYLRGINCSSDEVYFICTERFETDWARFLSEFDVTSSVHPTGVDGSEVDRSMPVMNARSRAADSRGRTARRRSVLSTSENAFVRDVLYPWDSALHRWACR